MSFLKKYQKQFEEAKAKYLPDEKKEEKPAAPASTAPTPTQNLTPAVPPGWTAQWDQEKNLWTYHEQATGKVQTEHPDPAQYGGQSMPPGGPVIEKDGKPKKDKNGMLIGAAGGLATGAFGTKLFGMAKKKLGGEEHERERSRSRSSSSSSSSDNGGSDNGGSD